MRHHDPKLGSQAKCWTISQHTSRDEDLSGEGRVADKAKEIPATNIAATDRAASVVLAQITALTFFVRVGRSLTWITCSLRIELPSLQSVAFVSCSEPTELAELRDLCDKNKDLLRTTPLGILALIYVQRVRSWEGWVASLWANLNEIEVLLGMAPPGWEFNNPTPQRVKDLSNPDVINRQFATTHAQICHSQVSLAFGVRYADQCREAMDIAEQARAGKRLQPGEKEAFEGYLRPTLSICKSVQDRSTDLLERLRGLISMTANMTAQKEARTNRDIAQTNLRVAQSAASDSRMMKTIGLLGVMFLPATFTTALWEVNLFQLDDETNKVVYAVTTVGLTLLVFGAWGSYMFMARKPLEWYRGDELEAARELMELRPLV
ncbi:hypothetical protein MFIFM68171_05850 [Madurella fahalii]|uniref:Uncharacterized protein n=1 Tax=Madurella fahalii TaxID=1157608 RepID=A0ABQ0GD74_9PEZI